MGVTAGFCALKARFIPLATRRTAESVMTKFGFIRSGKGEIFWRLQVYPFCFDVSMNSKE